jgi:hypothetical protein
MNPTGESTSRLDVKVRPVTVSEMLALLSKVSEKWPITGSTGGTEDPLRATNPEALKS